MASIYVSGTEVILSELQRMDLKETDLDAALEEGAKIVAEEIRNLAPVGRTGKLKAAVGVGVARPTKNGRMITAGIHRQDLDAEEYYPAYVEYGHGGLHPAEPHPFIRPAYDKKRDAAYAAIKRRIEHFLGGKRNV